MQLIDLYDLSREDALGIAQLANLKSFIHTSEISNENLEDLKKVSNYIDDGKASPNKAMSEENEKTKQDSTAGKIDIRVPNDVRILYSDSAFVRAGNFGIVIDFAQIMGNPTNQQIVTRVGMSKEHAEALMGALQTEIVKLQSRNKKSK
jgi:hypothetical protein